MTDTLGFVVKWGNRDITLFYYETVKKILWFIILGAALFGTVATVGGFKPENKIEEVAKNESPELFVSALDGIEFTEYGDPKAVLRYYSIVYAVSLADLDRTVQCESGFRHEGVYGDSGRAYGYAQFHQPTFDYYCPEMEYKDGHDQLWCMSRMFSDGEQGHWSCF